MRYAVYGRVVGSKYVGSFEANSPEEAQKMAEESDESYISFCHHCSGNCEDPEIDEYVVEPEDHPK